LTFPYRPQVAVTWAAHPAEAAAAAVSNALRTRVPPSSRGAASGVPAQGRASRRAGSTFSTDRVQNAAMTSFKEQFREFQRMVLELKRLRNHNVTFQSDSYEMFFMAEGTLVVLVLERFLRMILGKDADERDTMQNLLEKALSPKRSLIVLPGGLTRDQMREQIVEVRNFHLHGNYEQAATKAGLPSKDAYFMSSKYIKSVERLYRIANRIVAQVDEETGMSRVKDPAWTAYYSSPDFLDLSIYGPGEAPEMVRLVEQKQPGSAPRP
jgi:hypothetical protein